MGRKTMNSVKLSLEGVVFHAINLVGDCWTLAARDVATPYAQCAHGIDERGLPQTLRNVCVSSKTLQGSGFTLTPGASFSCERATIIYESSTLDCTIISVKRIDARWADGTPIAPDCSAAGEEMRPCVHNDWDDVRTRKGFKTLRCRVCQGRWKVRNTTPRCLAFLHDNCNDLDCEGIHVRRKKSPQTDSADHTPSARASISQSSEVVSCASDLPSTDVSDLCDEDLCAGLRVILSELSADGTDCEEADPADSFASLWALTPARSETSENLPVYVAPYPPMAHLMDPVYSRPPSCIVNCWLGAEQEIQQP